MYIEDREEAVPSVAELLKTCRYLLGSVVLLYHRICLLLVEHPCLSCEEVCRLLGSELLVLRVLSIAEDIDEGLGLAGSKCDLFVVRSYGRPAVSKGVGRLVSLNCSGVVPAVVDASEEGVTVCIVAVDSVVYCIERVVIASVSVLCYVVDSGALYLNASCGEVSLEVRAVVLSVPKAPLGNGED